MHYTQMVESMKLSSAQAQIYEGSEPIQLFAIFQSFIILKIATGGGGGDIGKKINNGGGDGGDDGGDDDDYYDDFEDEDEGGEGGLFIRRILLKELFDRKFVDAVLNEWQKTMMDLPAGLRQAYEMGLVSSAQLLNFLAMNARPTTVRVISRALPQSISRAFIGSSPGLLTFAMCGIGVATMMEYTVLLLLPSNTMLIQERKDVSILQKTIRLFKKKASSPCVSCLCID